MEGVLEAFYADAGELVLLEIDPALVAAEVRVEGGFPHLYGPLPVSAVTSARRIPPRGPGAGISGLR